MTGTVPFPGELICGMPEIALVTYLESPGLSPDDQLLGSALAARGATVHVTPWDAPAEWSRFDLVVLRSTWDYYLRPDEFNSWVDHLEALRVPLLNPYAVVRWNGDKRYLLQLEQRGVGIVPTALVERGTAPSLETLLRDRGWAEAVVKPVVSAAGHETWRTTMATAGVDEGKFRSLVDRAAGGVFVQPFMPEVVDDGELSLIFFDGRYSHAAIKRPRPGNFLVQHVHGGTYAPTTPALSVIEDAARVLAAAALSAGVPVTDFAYARVDGVVRMEGGTPRLVLMELECLEPALFFLQAQEAATGFAELLIARALAHAASDTYLR